MNESQPAPLPARMLNEFVYCPRLFYLMHLEGIFVGNADTLEGSALHKRVDAGNGRLPLAKSKALEPKRLRKVFQCCKGFGIHLY